MERKNLTIFSWALYDFANAIFGMNVIALYFVLWVTVEKGAQDIVYGFVLGLSMFVAAISMPILGAISDRKAKRMPYLIFFTLLCIIFLAIAGLVDSLAAGLWLFAVSNLGYLVSGALFYNTLLPYVADGSSIGKVSGYGVSLSYVGTITGLLAVRPIALKYGYQATFIPTALLFLVFSLPCFLFVKDKKSQKIDDKISLVRDAFGSLVETMRDIRGSRTLFSFFTAMFIIINIVNSVFIFMSVYLKKALLFQDSEIITLYLVSTVFSIAGAYLAGFITDKIGPKETLTYATLICGAAIGLAVISFTKALFWIIGPLTGIAFSAIRVSGRALAVNLFVKEMIGRVFGLLGFLSNLAFIGLLIWGAIVFIFGPLGIFKYRIALFVSLLILIYGILILQKVPTERKMT